MALGGGTFTAQNKILPGAYINFTSAPRSSAALSDRGIAAIPVMLNWGDSDNIMTVTAADFQKRSTEIFGYDYGAPEMANLRDIFQNIQTLYCMNLSSGVKAANILATAKYAGTRGNDISIRIENNEAATSGAGALFDVSTILDARTVDTQKGISSIAQLTPNPWVDWKTTGTLTVSAGMPMTGGTTGTITAANFQAFLDKVEAYSFNTLGCPSADADIKAMFTAFTTRLRDTVGVKFQCVIQDYALADYEGIISVGNVTDTPVDIVYWVTGSEAACPVNATLTNRTYTGEAAVGTNYTQTQLEAMITGGQFAIHRVGDTLRVLEDVNTLVNTTADKSADFKNNQTIRVLDQIGNDVAAEFNNNFLGKIPNDADGRVSLWNAIVRLNQALADLRAIEEFDSSTLIVNQGDSKTSVEVTLFVTPVNAMARLYMTVIVQ